MNPDRLIQLRTHDDGTDAWTMARIAAPAALAGLIDGYSDYSERTGSFATRRELPHAEGVLIVNLGAPIAVTGGNGARIVLRGGEGFVAGVHLRPALSHSGGAQAGLHVFLPLATLRRLLGVPMDELLDRVVPLEALLGAGARRLGERLVQAPDRAARVALLDAALARRIAQTAPLRREQTHALTLLRRRPDLDIAAVARDIGWSRKHLAAQVRDAVGIGPRSFRRLLRFQRVTAALDGGGAPGAGPNWAGVAHDAGYCDQPHLIREFREFAGLTPSAYLARSLADGGGLVEPEAPREVRSIQSAGAAMR